MFKSVVIFTIPAVLFCFGRINAQEYGNSEKLFSPSVGEVFYEMAFELAEHENASQAELKQAVIFLKAVSKIDERARYALPEMIKTTSQLYDGNQTKLILQLLNSYLSEQCNLETTEYAVQYLLSQLNSREQREEMLRELLADFGDKNKTFGSELSTLMAILYIEKTERDGAIYYLLQAYRNNKHNRLAFEKMLELIPEQIGPDIYLERLRLQLMENPLDLETALSFAEYAGQVQLYEAASKMYKYCADLYKHLNPSQPLPAYIYYPWALNSYNTERSPHMAIQIAKQIQQNGRFDLMLEAIAAKAAKKTGDANQANLMIQTTEEKALNLISSTDPNLNDQVTADQLAWFYCFVKPDKDKSLDWANKAFSNEPNSTAVSGILAYSLVTNGQYDLAKSLISDYRSNQIAALAYAMIQLEEKEHDEAIETLVYTISEEPGSLAAHKAKEILVQHQREYIPQFDPDVILTVMKNNLQVKLVPEFIEPAKMISVHINLRGSKFSYGNDLNATIGITNNSTEPLLITDNSFFKGNVRIDANVTGDINEEIKNLVSIKIKPSNPIESGQSFIIPVKLVNGKLKKILLESPQASLNIEFVVFADPIVDENDKIVGTLSNIEPTKTTIKRLGIDLTARFIQNRVNSLSKGKQGQKIQTAELFAGLLMEQIAMANQEPLYKFMYADWMPSLLKSALMNNLILGDWVAKIHTTYNLTYLPMDIEMINAVSENINDNYWPVRMITIYLLSQSQGESFIGVLNHTAKYDSNELVREMAIALGANDPELQKLENPSTADN